MFSRLEQKIVNHYVILLKRTAHILLIFMKIVGGKKFVPIKIKI